MPKTPGIFHFENLSQPVQSRQLTALKIKGPFQA
jgi:hypothetical protein